MRVFWFTITLLGLFSTSAYAVTVTKTIGSSGRVYSTMTLWEADLDVATTYSSGDDAVGECYADSDFDEGLNMNGGGTIGLNSVVLTVAAGQCSLHTQQDV